MRIRFGASNATAAAAARAVLSSCVVTACEAVSAASCSLAVAMSASRFLFDAYHSAALATWRLCSSVFDARRVSLIALRRAIRRWMTSEFGLEGRRLLPAFRAVAAIAAAGRLPTLVIAQSCFASAGCTIGASAIEVGGPTDMASKKQGERTHVAVDRCHLHMQRVYSLGAGTRQANFTLGSPFVRRLPRRGACRVGPRKCATIQGGAINHEGNRFVRRSQTAFSDKQRKHQVIAHHMNLIERLTHVSWLRWCI